MRPGNALVVRLVVMFGFCYSNISSILSSLPLLTWDIFLLQLNENNNNWSNDSQKGVYQKK